MSAKPSSPNVLILISILTVICLAVGCGDDRDPVSPTPEPESPDLHSLGVVRTSWTLASTPYPLVGDNAYERGTMRWHNPPPIPREDVYDEEVAVGHAALQPLRLIFRPHGVRIVGPDDDPCFMAFETKSWGGIMRAWNDGLPATEAGEQHWLKLRVKPSGGILHFDFGRINEDINGNYRLDTEDRGIVLNGVLEPDGSEDTGFDTLMDEDELGRCLQPYHAQTNPDPAGDNWWYNGYTKDIQNAPPPVPNEFYSLYADEINNPDHWMHYEWQNGTEGSVMDDAVRGRSDTEDIGARGLSMTDAYLSYEILLELTDTTMPFMVPGSQYNGWYTYRIPISGGADPDIVRSDPSLEIGWQNVTHVRVWFEQTEYNTDSLIDMDSLTIADWGIVSE